MTKAKSPFLEFVRAVVKGDVDEVSRRLATQPDLATARAEVGASRKRATDFFFREIAHYMYAGDMALHMAAAGFRRAVAEVLVEHGADWRVRNRRGAQALHYAADANRWEPKAQVETIEFLLSIGADPNSLDNSGVAPLHRAVRTRSGPAVRALLDGGADARKPNKAGSTALHLAVQTTGRGGSGSQRAREQQAEIIGLLMERGARATDKDGRGRQVREAAGGERVRALLVGGSG
jgi:ankyrin repeat protein